VANEPVSNAPASDAPASDAPKPEAPRPDAPITTAPIPTAVVTAAPAQKIDREWQQQAESGDLIGLDERLTRMAQSPDCGGCGEQIGRFRAWLTAHAPSAAPVVSVQATPRSPGCRGAETPPPLAFGADAGDTIPTSSNVCQVRYIVSGAAHVALVLSAPELQRGIDQRAEGAGHAALALDIPVVACCLNDQRIVALASPWPLDRVLDWLAPQIADFWQPLPDPLVARLAALGVTVRVLRHQIDLRPPR
jgi:hypothetical protein